MLEQEIHDIKIIVEQLKCYCAIQDKCEWDVIQKMKKWNLDGKKQNKILKILNQEKYINEERYSRSFCRGKFRIKKWGKIKIANELRKKDVDALSISKGLEEIDDYEYEQELNKQYHKKKNAINEKNTFIKNKKIASYLINKGYEYNFVWEKIRESKQ